MKKHTPLIAVLFLFTLTACSKPQTAAPEAANAAVISEQATKLHFAGQYGGAEALFREAYRLDPVPGYLYSAARAAHKGGKYEVAIATYEQLITQSPGTQFAMKAQLHRDKLKATLAADAAAKAPPAKASTAKLPEPVAANPAPSPAPPKPAPVVAAPTPAPQPAATPAPSAAVARQAAPNSGRSTAFVALGAGGLSLIAAGTFAALWAGEKSDYDALKQPNGTIVGTKTDLDSRVESMNNKLLVAYITGGVGLAAAGFGAYLLATRTGEGATVSIVPQTNGAILVARF